MYSYQTFGIGIHSDIELPELIAASVSADAAIRLGSVECPANLKENPDGRAFQNTGCGIIAWWKDVGTFRIHNGTEMIVDPAEGVEDQVLRNFILGTCISLIMHQRKNIVFHASAIEINGQVVGFMGEKGAGKSTTAAALLNKGYRLISDDILTYRPEASKPVILPGYPSLKLWPKSLDVVQQQAETLPKVHPLLDKRVYRLQDEEFPLDAIPLHSIFILDDRIINKVCGVEELKPQDALMEIMPHWMGARFGETLLDAIGKLNHLKECADLVGKVPVRLLKRNDRIEDLEYLVELVEQHGPQQN